MRRFKIEVKEKPKLTHKEEIQMMFDKRINDVNQILKHHQNGLGLIEISWKVRLAESYIQNVIRDGFEKTKIQLLEQYRLNGGEMMTERDNHGRFVKKEEAPKADIVSMVDTPKAEVVTSEKKTITDYIREIAKELGPFKPADMVEAFTKKGLSYKKSAIVAHIGALNVDASESVKKYQASIHKHAFLKKDADGKYTIV